MSWTTMKALWPGERQEDLEVLPRAFGGAPVVWHAMMARHCGNGRSMDLAEPARLRALQDRPDIPARHRALLLMTCDHAYVAKANYGRAADDIRAWLADFPQPPDRLNHWPRIAEIFGSDPDVPAIGFHWTSVTEDPFRGPWDDEADAPFPTDWSRCWEIYAHLDAMDGRAVA